jgi:hypothetical protein
VLPGGPSPVPALGHRKVVSAKAAWSGTSKRATPAALLVTVPAIEFLPSPVAFQTASLKSVCAGRPPMLYSDGGSAETVFSSLPCVFSSLPCVSSPMIVSSPFGPAYPTSSFSGSSSELAPPTMPYRPVTRRSHGAHAAWLGLA